MATNRNSQRERFNYLQSLYFQNMANKGSNHYSTGVIPEDGPGAGWMAMMGGVPQTIRGKGTKALPLGSVGGTAASTRERAARRAYNEMMAEKAGGATRFDPQNFLPPQAAGSQFPTFSPDDYMMSQFGGQQLGQGWQGYPPGYRPSVPPQIQDRVNQVPQQQPQGPTLYEQLAQSYLDQTNKANAANQERYDQGLGLALGLRDRNMDRIEQLGTQQASDIRRDYDKAGKAEYANLVGRGLAGSTVAGAVQRRVLDEQTQNLNRLEDFLARQRIDTDAGLTRNAQDFIERRNDIAPDMSMLAQLSQGLGAGNDGQGFGYIPQTQGQYTTEGNTMQGYYSGPQQQTANMGGYYARYQPPQPANPYNASMMRPVGQAQGYYSGQQMAPAAQQGYMARGPAQGYYSGPQQAPAAAQGYMGRDVANVGGKQILQGGPKPIDYAAAEQYKQSITPQAQPQRYQPNYGGGGYGGYGGGYGQSFAPIFANAGALGYSIPNASYGMQGGGMGGSGYAPASAYARPKNLAFQLRYGQNYMDRQAGFQDAGQRVRQALDGGLSPVGWQRPFTSADQTPTTSGPYQNYRQRLMPTQYGY